VREWGVDRIRAWRAFLAALTLLAAGCTGGSHPTPNPSSSVPAAPRGGTLRIVSPELPISSGLEQSVAVDPQKSYFATSWELFRCCLLRSLLAYKGAPTSAGGAILQPDLATSMPAISQDGLTWTFHLRPGIRYAPPLQAIEVTAQDFIRALEREANPMASAGGYSFYYSVIQGFDAYAKGEAESISGLEAPDQMTLRVHLVKPTGDLGERMSLAAAAPIPPNPFDPTAPLGVAEGHDDDDAGFVVATGPYMLEGAADLDFSLPPSQQRPASGFVRGKRIMLVRNPSWDPGSDSLRGAYVDRIEVTIGGTLEDAAAAVDQDRSDLVFYTGPSPQAPLDQVEAYQADPAKGSVSVEPADFVFAVAINLAVPPFDDVHVRKAMNLVLNKTRLQEIRGGPTAGELIGHVALNSLENNLLLSYDPYATPDHAGSVEAARKEMALSRYDRDGDGVCDDAVCSGILALGFDGSVIPSNPELSRQIKRDLEAIGIGLRLRLLPAQKVFARAFDPANHVALVLTFAWAKDYLNASTYFPFLFSAGGIGNGNVSLLGATRSQLRKWGYEGTDIPSVDDRIDSCLVQVGESQRRCWADLDQYLMEQVVPWIPYLSETHAQVVPHRIARYSYDQFADLPALDQIALRPGS
jgi:peptide/nickel transport system substrate-binding protein